MSATAQSAIAVIGIDIGKNSFHVVGLDGRGAIVLRQKWSRGQVEARFANMSRCLIGMEACVGAHHLSRKHLAIEFHLRLFGDHAPVQLFERRHVAGAAPNAFLNARENAASES